MAQIKRLTRISDRVLLGEVARRGLTLALVNQYLQQALMQPSKKAVFAFENDNGGHVLYWRHPEKRTEYESQIGPTGIRTIPADPILESVDLYVFARFWDFLAHVHTVGRERGVTYIITNGVIGEAAEFARGELHRTRRVLICPDRGFEHELLAELDAHHLPIGVWGQNASEALMQPDGHRRLAKSLNAPEQRPDTSHAASVTTRLKPQPA